MKRGALSLLFKILLFLLILVALTILVFRILNPSKVSLNNAVTNGSESLSNALNEYNKIFPNK